jgi:threonine dehydrogenase-like Zn-dependent dehydrogenase
MAADVGLIDLVYEATGASQLAFDVLRCLGPNGLFILTGVPGRHGPIEFDADGVMRNLVLKNQCLIGTVNAGKDAFEQAVADLSSAHSKWPGVVQSLITGRFPLDDFATPIHNQTGIKNVVEIAR